MMYSGDEDYSDEVTSGIFPEEDYDPEFEDQMIESSHIQETKED